MALRRLSHDVVIIGRPTPKGEPELFPLDDIKDHKLQRLLLDLAKTE